MDVKDLRSFSTEELTGKIKSWKEELFRSRFKTQSNENKDTSVLRKLRRDIARAYTILGQKKTGTEV